MFVTVALIGPNACSWPVSHLWSVLSAPRAPVTGSRLMASVENRGSDDRSGKIHVGASKIWLCDPSVQLWMLKIIISKFQNRPETEYCDEASLTVFSCLNQIDLLNNWKMTERCPTVCVKTLLCSHTGQERVCLLLKMSTLTTFCIFCSTSGEIWSPSCFYSISANQKLFLTSINKTSSKPECCYVGCFNCAVSLMPLGARDLLRWWTVTGCNQMFDLKNNL